jgi:hypothetical protein
MQAEELLYLINREYPGVLDCSETRADTANYATLTRNLRTAFQASGHNPGISMVLPSSF